MKPLEVDIKRALVTVDGDCSVCHEFPMNPPPQQHVPDSYELMGSTLFLSLSIPKFYNHLSCPLSFEWTFLPPEANHSSQVAQFLAEEDPILSFQIRLQESKLRIEDSVDTLHHTPITITSGSTRKLLQVMVAVTCSGYEIFTNCDDYQFRKVIQLQSEDFPKQCRMRLRIDATDSNGTTNCIGIKNMSIWRWVALDYYAFDFLCHWKDMFVESLYHLTPSRENILFDKNYAANVFKSQCQDATDSEKSSTVTKPNSECPLSPVTPEVKMFLSPHPLRVTTSKCDPDDNDIHFTVVDIPPINIPEQCTTSEVPQTPKMVKSKGMVNQYTIILSFFMKKCKIRTPICLLQIPDELTASMLQFDNCAIISPVKVLGSSSVSQTPKPLRPGKSGCTSPLTESVNSCALMNSSLVYGHPQDEDKYLPSARRISRNKPSPEIPMVWVCRRGYIWICNQRTNQKVSINDANVLSLCVNLKKRELSIIFRTDEIMKVNLRVATSKPFKWMKYFKPNGPWALRSKLIVGGTTNPPNRRNPTNFVIKRITIKPKCASTHEAVSLALNSLFKDDPLSDLMGNLGFSVEQIKYSKKWKSSQAQSEWMDMLMDMVQTHSSSHCNSLRTSRSNSRTTSCSKIRVPFNKNVGKRRSGSEVDHEMMPPPAYSMMGRKKKYQRDRKPTKTYIHICAQSQLDMISPEEIRWKLYHKTMVFHRNNLAITSGLETLEQEDAKQDDEGAIPDSQSQRTNNMDYEAVKSNLLLCSHWLYCQIPSTSQQKQILAKRLCNFTGWSQSKLTWLLLKMDFKSDWYHLVEIMYAAEIQESALKFSGKQYRSGLGCEVEHHGQHQPGAPLESGVNEDYRGSDALYHEMKRTWTDYAKHLERVKTEACGLQSYDSSSYTVFETPDRIYQDSINDRWKFHSIRQPKRFKEIGNFQAISKRTFQKLSKLMESNLSSLYARDAVLAFLDEFSCYDDALKGLLPSINFHNAFDNISEHENLVKFLQLVFEEEKFARIHALEKAVQCGIEEELDQFDGEQFVDEYMKQKAINEINQVTSGRIGANQYGFQLIAALMNTVVSRLVQYMDAIHCKSEEEEHDINDHKEPDLRDSNHLRNKSDKMIRHSQGKAINIEFALWIVSIFVAILNKVDGHKEAAKHEYLYKMLVLVFNKTLMSLLFDCIVIAPAAIAVKVALMVSQIIEKYPKENPFQSVKRKLLQTSKLCTDLRSKMDVGPKWAYHTPARRLQVDTALEVESESPVLSISVKHITVIANVLQEMHHSSDSVNDVIIVLTQLMLSITSCNYHHEHQIELLTLDWFRSVSSTYTALRWFSLKNPNERTAASLQFMAPFFYCKLYDNMSSWVIFLKDKASNGSFSRNRTFMNVLRNNVDGCTKLLDSMTSLLTLPVSKLSTEGTLEAFTKNMQLFCDLAKSLCVDQLTDIQAVVKMNAKWRESQKQNEDDRPDWLILQQIKQICGKLGAAFASLYDNIFASDSNAIDGFLSAMGTICDSAAISRLVDRSLDDCEIEDVSGKFSFESYITTKDDMIWNENLRDIDSLTLNVAQESIFYLNQLLLKNVRYFDLTAANPLNRVCDCRHLMISIVANSILNDALQQSQDGSATEPSFQVDRFRCKSSDEPDYLMFTECMKQLHSFKPETFRLEAHSKAWKCQFANEHATDAGGPYRESIEWMCNEVMTNQTQLALFRLCANGMNDRGQNRDKYVPSPNKCSHLDETMYIFLGKLMGLAMRTKELLPLNIAPVIWKRICERKITVKDILSSDISAFSIFEHLDPFIKMLDKYKDEIDRHFDSNTSIISCGDRENKDIEEALAQIEIFNSLMVRTRSKFQGKSSDGDTYPLIPNGELIPITHQNVRHYKTAFINFRLREYDFACDAIRRGLATVIPIHMLNIFSWNKVEELICGQATIDVKLFKQMTTYSNCSLSDRTIQVFWDVVKHKMNNKERSRLLQFAWGRSRLPANKQDFDKKMSILLLDHTDGDPNDYLPVSHTCFFQLDLPRYTDADIMYTKLVYAITHCGSIDTDE